MLTSVTPMRKLPAYPDLHSTILTWNIADRVKQRPPRTDVIGIVIRKPFGAIKSNLLRCNSKKPSPLAKALVGRLFTVDIRTYRLVK